MSDLDKTDEVAANLARAYQRQGEFCIVVRTDVRTKNIRLIYPKIDVTQVSELLHKAADVLFDGNPKNLRKTH